MNLVIAGFESLKLLGIFIVGVVVEMYEIAVNSVIIFEFFFKLDVAGIEGSEIIEIFIEVVVELFEIDVDFVVKYSSCFEI